MVMPVRHKMGKDGDFAGDGSGPSATVSAAPNASLRLRISKGKEGATSFGQAQQPVLVLFSFTAF